MEYVTIASTGNATDFGDLTQTLDSTSALSSPTRGVFIQGINPASARLLNWLLFVHKTWLLSLSLDPLI